jgi:hypothetical protein
MRKDKSPRYVARGISRISNVGGQLVSSMAVFAVLIGGMSLAGISHEPDMQSVPVIWAPGHSSDHDEDGEDHTAAISNQLSFDRNDTTLADFVDTSRIPKSQPVKLCLGRMPLTGTNAGVL